MCGINGIIHFETSRNADQFQILRMRDSMHHRGPDGAGLYISKNIGLGHRRLSIIDLSEAGKQPFTTNDGRYTIVYNGEIFNYQELKQELLEYSISFRSASDTEVLLNLYVQYGEACLQKLNGMFAFAIWDHKEHTLFCARDRMGIKPFYYTVYNNSFYFASEPKAIFAAGVPSEINRDALDELLLFRFVAGENMMFRNIKRLLPGHTLTIKNGSLSFNRWWNLPEIIQENRECLPRDPFTWFEETFYSAVRYRTISDVPVGLMLSGGLDSGSIAVALQRIGHEKMAAFTVTFSEAAYNEGHLASEVARKFDLDYYPISIEGSYLMDKLKEAAWYHDEPLIHQNDAQLLALSQFAKPHVSVLLSGEGSDEFLGGYLRYKPLKYFQGLQSLKPLLSLLKYFRSGGIVNRFDKLNRYLSIGTQDGLVLMNASNMYPKDLKNLGYSIDFDRFEYRNQVLKEAKTLYPTEASRQAMYMDIHTHLPSVLDRNDRMTMGAGIECRVPFMDYRILEMAPALPSNLLLRGKKGKRLLFESVAQKLPPQVLHFKKLGFSVPWESYIGKDEVFRSFIDGLTEGKALELFEGLQAKQLMADFKNGDSVAITLIRQLFMIELWITEYLNKVNSTRVPQ
jgi:asparagine synthase (glutamine-hydrolysing)